MPVQLRAVTVGDAPDLARMINDPLIARYISFPPVNEAIIREWIALEEEREGPRIYSWWSVELEEPAQLAGCAGLVLEPLPQSAEIWYLLDQPYWGRGYGTEVARALIHHAFAERGLHRLWAQVAPENVASIRILESCGMRREGCMKRNLPVRGEWLDSYLYAMLREEWALTRAPAL